MDKHVGYLQARRFRSSDSGALGGAAGRSEGRSRRDPSVPRTTNRADLVGSQHWLSEQSRDSRLGYRTGAPRDSSRMIDSPFPQPHGLQTLFTRSYMVT